MSGLGTLDLVIVAGSTHRPDSISQPAGRGTAGVLAVRRADGTVVATVVATTVVATTVVAAVATAHAAGRRFAFTLAAAHAAGRSRTVAVATGHAAGRDLAFTVASAVAILDTGRGITGVRPVCGAQLAATAVAILDTGRG